MFLNINIFWALLRAHFYHRLTVGAQVSLSRAQNTFKAYLCFISRTFYKQHLTCDIVNITVEDNRVFMSWNSLSHSCPLEI